MAKHGRDKRPVIKATPQPRKIARWAGNAVHENQRLSWRFSAADNGGPFAWNACHDRLAEVLGLLAEWELLDMNSLRDIKHTHPDLSRLTKEATQRLQEIQRDDADRLFSFHIKGKERIWCLDLPGEGVMFVMWWDPDHKVYYVPKKGT